MLLLPMRRKPTSIILILTGSIIFGLLWKYDVVLFSFINKTFLVAGGGGDGDNGKDSQRTENFSVKRQWTLPLLLAKSVRRSVSGGVVFATDTEPEHFLHENETVDVLARNKVVAQENFHFQFNHSAVMLEDEAVTSDSYDNSSTKNTRRRNNYFHRVCAGRATKPPSALAPSLTDDSDGEDYSPSSDTFPSDVDSVVAAAAADFEAGVVGDDDADPLEPQGSDVLNPYPFRFVIEEADACCRTLELYKIPKDDSSRLKAVILVHTHPEAFENRQTIRQTWAVGRWQKRFLMLTLFVMGMSQNATVQAQLQHESQTHHDIIQSNFIASYWNNTYNTMAALKWATANCHEQTHFIVKTDDDFVLNIFRFNIYLTGILNKRGLEQSHSDMFVRCASLFRRARPIRDKSSKWYVTRQAWPQNFYPAICLGGAIMFTPASAERLFLEAHYYEFFPLDDVFITGIVAQNITDFKLIHMPGPNGWVQCHTTQEERKSLAPTATGAADPKCLIKNRVMFYHTLQDKSIMMQFWNFLESQYERKLQLLGFQ